MPSAVIVLQLTVLNTSCISSTAWVIALSVSISVTAGTACLMLLPSSSALELTLRACCSSPHFIPAYTLQCCHWREKLDILHLESTGEKLANANCLSDLIMRQSKHSIFAHVFAYINKNDHIRNWNYKIPDQLWYTSIKLLIILKTWKI